jgi:hypothetical protein
MANTLSEGQLFNHPKLSRKGRYALLWEAEGVGKCRAFTDDIRFAMAWKIAARILLCMNVDVEDTQ